MSEAERTHFNLYHPDLTGQVSRKMPEQGRKRHRQGVYLAHPMLEPCMRATCSTSLARINPFLASPFEESWRMES